MKKEFICVFRDEIFIAPSAVQKERIQVGVVCMSDVKLCNCFNITCDIILVLMQ